MSITDYITFTPNLFSLVLGDNAPSGKNSIKRKEILIRHCENFLVTYFAADSIHDKVEYSFLSGEERRNSHADVKLAWQSKPGKIIEDHKLYLRFGFFSGTSASFTFSRHDIRSTADYFIYYYAKTLTDQFIFIVDKKDLKDPKEHYNKETGRYIYSFTELPKKILTMYWWKYSVDEGDIEKVYEIKMNNFMTQESYLQPEGRVAKRYKIINLDNGSISFVTMPQLVDLYSGQEKDRIKLERLYKSMDKKYANNKPIKSFNLKNTPFIFGTDYFQSKEDYLSYTGENLTADRTKYMREYRAKLKVAN